MGHISPSKDNGPSLLERTGFVQRKDPGLFVFGARGELIGMLVGGIEYGKRSTSGITTPMCDISDSIQKKTGGNIRPPT